ncbi:MAG: DUF167 domain-containing protein [Bdellovibrionota bacterium]
MTLLRFWVQPRASRTRVIGIRRLAEGDERIKIQLSAPPVDGAANEALIEFLAKALALPKANLTLKRGAASRQKDVECSGIDLATAMQKLFPSTDPTKE